MFSVFIVVRSFWSDLDSIAAVFRGFSILYGLHRLQDFFILRYIVCSACRSCKLLRTTNTRATGIFVNIYVLASKM